MWASLILDETLALNVANVVLGLVTLGLVLQFLVLLGCQLLVQRGKGRLRRRAPAPSLEISLRPTAGAPRATPWTGRVSGVTVTGTGLRREPRPDPARTVTSPDEAAGWSRLPRAARVARPRPDAGAVGLKSP